MKIGNENIAKGERKKLKLEVGSLFDHTKQYIPVEVIRGKLDGPVLFISAAIHGDELNGVEIIKRISAKKLLNRLRGTLILVPVVNVYGFNSKSRYLPDRRDLNRCFPGSSRGSLGSQLANVFMTEIVSLCTHGIDLHTGAIHRSNFPQVRACLDDDDTYEMAKNFGAAVIVDSKLRDGSLREAAREKNITTLLFEGGEALRFEEDVVRVGVRGCMSVMRSIGILPSIKKKDKVESIVAKSSFWLRAKTSGILNNNYKLGDKVFEGQCIANISDVFGGNLTPVCSPKSGVIIGITKVPLVSSGDALIHIATFENFEESIEHFDQLDSDY